MPAIDSDTLMAAAKCYSCIPDGMRIPVLIYLFNTLASGGVIRNCGEQSGRGSPVGSVTPEFIGQLYHDTVADTYYRSTGLTPADWTLISGGAPAGCGWTWGPDQTIYDFIDIDSDPNVETMSFPSLVTLGPNTGYLYGAFCPNLVSVDLPALVTTVASGPGFGIQFPNCPKLTSVSCPELITTGGDFNVSSCGMLSSVVLPKWLPANATTIRFDGCALPGPVIELILRRCVLAGVTTCTINLSGGTNAGTASLNAQGQADVATLGAQLTINP